MVLTSFKMKINSKVKIQNFYISLFILVCIYLKEIHLTTTTTTAATTTTTTSTSTKTTATTTTTAITTTTTTKPTTTTTTTTKFTTTTSTTTKTTTTTTAHSAIITSCYYGLNGETPVISECAKLQNATGLTFSNCAVKITSDKASFGADYGCLAKDNAISCNQSIFVSGNTVKTFCCDKDNCNTSGFNSFKYLDSNHLLLALSFIIFKVIYFF